MDFTKQKKITLYSDRKNSAHFNVNFVGINAMVKSH